MTDAVRKLISDPNKGRPRAQNVLCWLFRDVLVRRHVTQFVWNKRVKRYFNKPHNNITKPDRGNLNKILTTDHLTWPAFKKCVDFLDPEDALFKVRFTWHNGRVSEYKIRIDPASKTDEILLEEGETPPNATDSILPKTRGELTTLALLFRRILIGEHIDQTRWDALLDAWVQNPNQGIRQNRTERLAWRNERAREIARPAMTWDVFRKAVIVLDPDTTDYILELKWPDGWTIHQIDLPTL